MKDGVIFYQGPVQDIASYFSRFGYDCPTNYNPSDFVMHLSQTESQEVLAEKGMFDFASQRRLSNAGKINDECSLTLSLTFPPAQLFLALHFFIPLHCVLFTLPCS